MQFLTFVAARADTGAALPFARVTVFQSNTSTLAFLYSATGAGLPNPFNADAAGLAGFAAQDGAYDVQVQSADGAYSVPLLRGVQLADLSAAVATTGANAAAAIAAASAAALAEAMAAGMVGGGPYPDTATGLAAVTANAFFTVVGDGASSYAILYRKVSGAAVEQARFPSKAYLDNLLTLRPRYAAFRAKLARGEAVAICCLGDSTTAGVGTTGWAANGTVGDPTYAPAYAYPAVLQALLRSIAGTANATTYNAGYSGFTTASLLANYGAIMGQMPALDVVILGAGLNDEQYDLSAYPSDVDAMVQRIIAGGSIPVLLSQDPIMQTATGLGADARRDDRASAQMAPVLEGLAAKYGIPFVDMHAALLEHWRCAEDGVLSEQGAQCADNLHGGDHVHAFKASFILKALIGRVAELPTDKSTNLAPWSDAAGPAPAAISRLSYNRLGGNLLFQTWTAGETMMDAWVWNPGPRTACFARLVGNNGAAGQRIKAEALSYSALPALRDTAVLNDGVAQPADYAEAEGAMFVCVLAHGLNRVRWTAPATVTSNTYPGFLQFIPGYKLDRVPGQFTTVSTFAAREFSRLLPAAAGFQAYPRREDADGGNLISVGPDANHITRVLIEAVLPATTGLALLDGQAWNPFGNFPAADVQASRVGIYLFRGTDGYLSLGSMEYPPSSGFGGFSDVVLSAAPLDWTAPLVMLVELWREASDQRCRVSKTDGTVLIDATRPFSGRPYPSGGCIGGFVSSGLSGPALARYRVLSIEMSA